MAIYDLTQITPTKLETGDIINVPYSGAYKTITLPKCRLLAILSFFFLNSFYFKVWGLLFSFEGLNR